MNARKNRTMCVSHGVYTLIVCLYWEEKNALGVFMEKSAKLDVSTPENVKIAERFLKRFNTCFLNVALAFDGIYVVYDLERASEVQVNLFDATTNQAWQKKAQKAKQGNWSMPVPQK